MRIARGGIRFTIPPFTVIPCAMRCEVPLRRHGIHVPAFAQDTIERQIVYHPKKKHIFPDY